MNEEDQGMACDNSQPSPQAQGTINLNFGEALAALRRGARVCRTGWNGKGMWIELQRPDSGSKMTLPYLYLNYPVFSQTENIGSSAYPEGSRVPWLASGTDLLADDWMIL